MIVKPMAVKINFSGQREQETELRLKQLNNQPVKSIERAWSSQVIVRLRDKNILLQTQVMPVRFLTLPSVVRCLLVVLTAMVTNIVEPVAGKVNFSGQQKQVIELRLKQLNKQALKSIENGV
ncbi:hypothetical protein Bca52824_008197 [Brassica carinata]|uniref:Uncharacterized protein n=1 Tax=Brassica carinata TaxID=52824 RepID=A0A8X7W7M9_BRACI|nr:hypothetical protein Bca52824_008197 [Brassica carinata]